MSAGGAPRGPQDGPEDWARLGVALAAAGQRRAAIEALGRALAAAPGDTASLHRWITLKLQCCDWAELDRGVAALSRAIREDAGEIFPFTPLPICYDPAELLRAARNYARRVSASVAGLRRPPSPAPAGDGRLRIGYLSRDLQLHAVGLLTAELFEAHDRTRVEVVACSYGPTTDDPLQRRLRAGFDRWLDLEALSTEAAAAAIAAAGVDILVDLTGYTQGTRPGILALRPAPLQIGYLGFPGSWGADWIDYLICDRVTVPAGAEGYYHEAPLRLPGCFQPNDGRRPAVAAPPPRAALGLPEEGFVFCSFAQPYKIMPDLLATWFRLLHAVPGSVLWLRAFNAEAEARLRSYAAAAGLERQRLVFAPGLPFPEHFARHAAADLILDTFPYGAHTTASDALWAGVPLLTRIGRTFPSRVAASLLATLGLPELVTDSAEGYAAAALALARDPPRLAALRRRVAAAREASDLFSGRAIAAKLESAYSAVWARHRAGLPPASLELAG